jgi:hypothetical protein
VLVDGHLFLSASYGIGAKLAKLSALMAKDAEVIAWESDDVMSSQYSTSVIVDGALYGVDGRQDGPAARLRAVNPLTGEVLWTKEGFGMGTIIAAGKTLLVQKVDGELTLIAADPDEYRELASAKLFDSTVQALPALAGGRFYARDTSVLKCFEVGKK